MTALESWTAIPAHLRGPLARYILNGVEPGGFLRAVLENDLQATFMALRGEDFIVVGEVLVFLSNATRFCHGSKINVTTWAAYRRMHPKESALPRDMADLEAVMREDAAQ